MAVATAPAPSIQGALTHSQILTILAGLMMGMFLAALDQTVVSSAMRVIADDLHNLAGQAWVITAYLITSTIVTPLYGKLSDIYGRKPFFTAAIVIFLFGSILCSFATSMPMLASLRAVQGLGAGGLFSLALAIIGDIVPPRQRAKYQGYFLAVFGTSSVLGPVVGGFFAGQSQILGITGWRWVFLVNVPIGIAALFVVNHKLHLRHTRLDHRIDFGGAIALTVGLVPLLLVAEQGRTWGWANSVGGLLRHRTGRCHRVLPGRALDGRRGTATAAPVHQQDGGRRLHRLSSPGHGHVRWAGLPAALPADRQGGDPDQRWPDAPADDSWHDGWLNHLGSDHLQDGPVPAVPDHRMRPAHRLAVRVPLCRGRYSTVADDDPDALLRSRARRQHAATDSGRAKCRLPARHRRGHLIGDVHASDRRHFGHRHLLVHLVLHSARPNRDRLPHSRPDPRVPGSAQESANPHRQPCGQHRIHPRFASRPRLAEPG